MWYFYLIISLVLAPLLPGIINKTKASSAGRNGPRVLQLYYDIAKLLRKGSVRSTTSTILLQLAPSLSLATLLTAMLFFPFGMSASPLAFQGDIIVFFYLLATGRMVMVLGALDTGSAFEGMGASREVQFSALAEVVTFAVIGFLALLSGSTSLSGALNGFNASAWTTTGTSMTLAAMACFVVLLAENCRVPFDDPDTHLELTMIHEAMILDNSGPDLAFIDYAAALKLWLLASFLVLLLLPFEPAWGATWRVATYFVGVLVTSVVVGITESIMARFRFLKLPQLFAGALAIALVAILLFSFFKA